MPPTRTTESETAGSEEGWLWSTPEEFRTRLSELAERTLRDDPGLQAALARWRDELIVPQLIETVDHRAAKLLARTNRELDDVAQKRQALDDYTGTRESAEFGQFGRRLALGAGVLSVLAFPVWVWQTWPALSTWAGGPLAVLLTLLSGIMVGAVGVVLFVLGQPDRPPRRYLRPATDGDIGFDLASASLLGALVIGYLIALWQLLTDTIRHVGPVWAAVIWIVPGAFALWFGGLAVFLLAKSEFPRGRKVRGACLLLASVAGAVAVWGLLTPLEPIPPHVPEIAALAVALVIGSAGPAFLRLLLARIRRLLADTAMRMAPGSSVATALRTEHERKLRSLQHDIDVAEQRWEDAARPLLIQRLQAEIAQRVSPGFATTLDEISPHGLQQMRGPDYIVHTRSFDRLSAEISGLSGGAVGLAGPRGVGKSSLLDQYRAGRITEAGTAGRQLVVTESVPVTYEPKEYVLYLYGRLCEEVAAFAGPPPGTRRRRAPGRHLGPVAAVGLVWMVAVVVGTGRWSGLDYRPPSWLASGWLALAVTGILAGAIALGAGTRRMTDDLSTEEGDPADLADLRQRAERRLRTIRFQQKETFGSTGKVRLPFAAERGATAAQEFQRYPMPYPEIANELHKFLTMTTRTLARSAAMSRIPVVVVFDELDKIADPDRVQDFLNTVKSLFSLEIGGCLFLVSVSDDALSRFDRRGLPVRDALDSTFDAVVPVEYLNLDDATALIADRVAGLPDPFIALLHTLGGGLPRELLRYTRALVRHRDEKGLAAISQAMVGDELRAKARGLGAVIARRGLVEPYASDLMRFVNDNTAPQYAALLTAISSPPLAPATDNSTEQLADALHLQMETLGFLYYCATVLQVFDDLKERGFERRRASFDTLASARQLFGVNARLAWLTVGSFRREWSMTEVVPPDLTGPADHASAPRVQPDGL
ncbi:hypothetical protein JIG36_10330 [Actinoplanes sp. LDG1-06]|uniref:KAP NTPase domain-containing protein n=1 Tax=Paractinoplanes ovalisporus TaxID=2810368 RepID=A0ABS2A7Z2_9ACTN|nr:hypothetical protein [Actinoplanes ovalisporus]MBM2615952.1 hypothetical protein [Actinoplanes ovalisporus]